MNTKSPPLFVFFSKRDALFSRLISYFQDGISHTGFRFYLPLITPPWILEAKASGGFGYSDHEEFEKTAEVVEEFEILWTHEEREHFIDLTKKLLREKYGWLGLIGMTVVLLCKKLGGWSDNPFPQGIFCSQATYRILKDVFKFYIDGNPNERRVGPDDLRIMLRQLAITQPEKVKKTK